MYTTYSFANKSVYAKKRPSSGGRGFLLGRLTIRSNTLFHRQDKTVYTQDGNDSKMKYNRRQPSSFGAAEILLKTLRWYLLKNYNC